MGKSSQSKRRASHAEALIKFEAREARLLGLDMPSKLEVTEEGNGIPLEALRALMNRADVEPIDGAT